MSLGCHGSGRRWKGGSVEKQPTSGKQTLSVSQDNLQMNQQKKMGIAFAENTKQSFNIDTILILWSIMHAFCTSTIRSESTKNPNSLGSEFMNVCSKMSLHAGDSHWSLSTPFLAVPWCVWFLSCLEEKLFENCASNCSEILIQACSIKTFDWLQSLAFLPIFIILLQEILDILIKWLDASDSYQMQRLTSGWQINCMSGGGVRWTWPIAPGLALWIK